MGVVTDDFRIIVDDGQVYEIASNDKGYELFHLAGKRIIADGVFQENEFSTVFVVLSFDVIGGE
jgi:hypothetical protein